MELRLVERTFSNREESPSVLLANLHGTIDMAQNLRTLEEVIELAHNHGANMLVFPELAVSGYVWDTPRRQDVLEHLRAGEMGRLQKWVRRVVDSLRTDGRGLEYVFLGNVREVRAGLYNSVFILHPGVDYIKEEFTYDKIFIPHNEQHYFQRGSDKRLTINTKWGRLGFMICYDLCFVELARRYAFID
ncbi:MAG: carbon-nitrogen hydrolase family protein, partial [Candidatus Bipolaricaulota bacterium]